MKKPKKPEKSARENEILPVKKTKNWQKKAFTPTFFFTPKKKTLKGGSFARSRKGAIFFCHDRKKKRRSFAREEEKLPQKKFLGRLVPGI